VSNHVLNHVWRRTPEDVSQGEMLALITLADEADDYGRLPYARSYAYLAKKLRAHEDTAKRNLRSLEQRGMVECLPGAIGQANGWRVAIDAEGVWSPEDMLARTPHPSAPRKNTPPQNAGGTPPQTAPPRKMHPPCRTPPPPPRTVRGGPPRKLPPQTPLTPLHPTKNKPPRLTPRA
jgi:hypothetical protein